MTSEEKYCPRCGSRMQKQNIEARFRVPPSGSVINQPGSAAIPGSRIVWWECTNPECGLIIDIL